VGGGVVTKEKSCLVTQNLIEKVRWYLDAPNSIVKADKGGDGKITWKEKALLDLSNTLNRVPSDFPLAAKRGVEFEKVVYHAVEVGKLSGSEFFQSICKELAGFEFYKKGGKKVQMDGLEVYFYAKYDAITPDRKRIKDLKTTDHYKAGKYLKGIQHKIYCFVADAPEFEYVIAEWAEHPKIKAVHKEMYRVADPVMLEKDILYATRECFDTIKDLGLWEAYRTKYCLY
jgi:hypothetical protein